MILSDPARLARMREDLREVSDRLKAGGGSGAERAARAVMEVAGQNNPGQNNSGQNLAGKKKRLRIELSPILSPTRRGRFFTSVIT